MADNADLGRWDLFDPVDNSVNNFLIVRLDIRTIEVEQYQGVFFLNPIAVNIATTGKIFISS